MKKIFRICWFYLQIEVFFLNRNEAILHYCASDLRFHKDDFRPYRHYFSVFDGERLIGSVAFLFDEWVFVHNALTGD
jgi:hypothetical protein